MHTPRGLSFIEMLVTLAVFSLIMVSIVNSVLFFYRANTSSLEQGYQVESARRGTEVFVRDVREATYGDDGAYPMQTMASSTVIFYTNADSDTAIERVKYSLSGTSLYRNIVQPSGTPPAYTGGGVTTTVSSYVRNFDENSSLFKYYNASSTEVTNSQYINTVVSVTINLVVDIVQKHAPGRFTLSESATLRNVRAQ
jgi:prepilin-type N-terminal cleavage/methylation domain-containing protein